MLQLLEPIQPRQKLLRGLASVAALTGLLWLAAPSQSAHAQFVPELQNGQVDIDYVAPSDSSYQKIFEGLKKRQVLEELRQFLAPLRLPRKLLVKTAECGSAGSGYDADTKSVTICYEWINSIIRMAPADKSPEGFTREDAIVGPFVEVVLHETARAIFDMLEVPLFGREGDAADQLAGFIMLQFGKEVARRTLNGTAYFFQAEAQANKLTDAEHASRQSPDLQRFYNFLCIAYGGDPETFRVFIQKKLLPPLRSGSCGWEYLKIRYAFLKTIAPFIDQDLLRKVQSTQWLLSNDGK